jgi:hypothetical protein
LGGLWFLVDPIAADGRLEQVEAFWCGQQTESQDLRGRHPGQLLAAGDQHGGSAGAG